VSNGVTGMLHVGFGALPEAERCLLGERFLALYAQNLTAGTQLFPDMAMVLSALEDAGVPWGVVTNKAARFTEPILAALGLSQRCACVVSGDTLPERKPSPAPLLHAAAQIPGGGAAAVYVGDAARDITAGRAAGMRTVAALYGYIPPGDDPQRWGADHAIGAPLDLVPLLLTATRRGLAAS
jgi:phosphoglycolate phosphatase